MNKHLIEFIKKFKKQHILVVGDVMVDTYIKGEISRISPEAPVPILNIKSEEHRLGGAANVANNIVALGAKCTLIGQVGKDEIKKILIDQLDNNKINHFLIKNKNYLTINKKRIISNNQQIIRIDSESTNHLENKEIDKVINFIKKNKIKNILISDYNKGMITKELLKKIKALNINIFADPKPENFEYFKNCLAISPNLVEAKKFTKKSKVEDIGEDILKKLKTNLILTRGKEGVSLFNLKDGSHNYIPAKANEVYDVSGAGDTFISTLTLTYASGGNLYESAILGNAAAGEVIKKQGVVTISQEQLKNCFIKKNGKIKKFHELTNLISDLKKYNKKIVFTNGCFDILHSGHIKLLNKAKSFGDILIVGLNTDKSVRNIKGNKRPINSQEDRVEVLSNLEAIDFIVLFDENTPKNLISKLKPDVHVKGGDYDPNDLNSLPEAETIKNYGGKIKIVNLVKGKSTTNIIKKSKNV